MLVWTHPVFQLFRTYTGMTNRAVTKCLKSSIQGLLDILRSTKPGVPTLFATELKPTVPELTISPSVANLQQTLNEVVRVMLRSTREIATWPTAMFPSSLQQEQADKENQHEEKDPDNEDDPEGLIPADAQDYRPTNYFNYLSRDNLGIAMLILVTNKMGEFEPLIAKAMQKFGKHSSPRV
jgi:hypothetical protein